MIRLAAIVFTLAATAAAADCEEAAKAYGEIRRAASICELPQPAVDRAEQEMKASCPNPDATQTGIEVGARTFDRDKGRRGLHEACFAFAWAQRFDQPPK